MFNFFTKNKKEKNSIIKAFPLNLRGDVMVVIDILPLNKKRISVDGQKYKLDSLVHEDTQSVYLSRELLIIPNRVYFEEPPKEKEDQLTKQQKTILNCLYLRHSDGHIRQKRLEMLLRSKEDYVVPFIIHLLGEYIVEIFEPLDRVICSNMLSRYRKFIIDNPKYWVTIKSRVISYWNVFYRKSKYPNLATYPGTEIVNKIKRPV